MPSQQVPKSSQLCLPPGTSGLSPRPLVAGRTWQWRFWSVASVEGSVLPFSGLPTPLWTFGNGHFSAAPESCRWRTSHSRIIFQQLPSLRLGLFHRTERVPSRERSQGVGR